MRWFDMVRVLLAAALVFLFGCANEGGAPPLNDDSVGSNNLEQDDLLDFGNNELSEYELALIEQTYGELTKEEWDELYDEVDRMDEEAFEAWIDAMEEYVEQLGDSRSELAYCSGYYGGKIGYGNFGYSTSSNYSHLWSTNCWFWSWSQCGTDMVLSFWMGPDYRGSQGKLKAYASSSLARWYLAAEGGYAGEIWSNGTYSNFYGCWPIEAFSLAGYAQLKQLN